VNAGVTLRPSAHNTRGVGPGLPLVFFLSGAAGLIFEIAWFQRCGLVFGNSVIAATVVLSSFMAGLALGNAGVAIAGPRIGRHLATYASLEFAIAVTGIALTYVLPALASHAVPLATAFFLLLVPASAMGATLPLLVAALRRSFSCAPFGHALGQLYGWNTFGAVGGALAAEFVLIARVGVAGSAWTAAGLDVVAGALALMITNRPPGPPSKPFDFAQGKQLAVSVNRTADSASMIVSAFLCGLTLLALEVIWFRFLSMFVLTTTAAMSVMLATVLSGIAMGGLAASGWSRRADTVVSLVPVVAFGAACAVAMSYWSFQSLTSGSQIGDWPRVLWLAIVMTLPASFLSGVLFTLLGDGLSRTMEDDDARAAGTVTLANTIGAAVGPPLAALVLLPRLGTERAIFALALIYGVVALCTMRLSSSATRIKIAMAILTAIVMIRFPFGLAAAYQTRVAGAYAGDGSRVVATREGPIESILLMQQQWMGKPVYTRLVTNGFSMSGTAIPGQRYMKYFVYWPAMVHRRPVERILVICYGVGVTASAATDVTTAKSIDIVELSRDVVAMSDVIYANDRDPLRDPRVALHVEDGRHFLQTTAERFDLITGEPPPPRTPGSVDIYTREYFTLIRDRLADEGVATYWLPVARPHPGTDAETIIRAFCAVFDDCSLWNGTPFDLMLVGTRHGAGRFDAARFEALRDRLTDIGFETPEQIGATFLGDAAYLRQLTAATPPLTDDFPQRLRPVDARPSLSDPRYPADLSVVAHYQRVLDPDRARAAFARSEFIARVWPEPLRSATLPWFDEEKIVNRVLWEGGKPLRLIEDLDATLTKTPLRTLPLWILGSDAVKQRIASTGDDGTGTVEYLRGAQILIDRDYASAASYFGLAERRGLRAPAVRPMMAYALCKAGRRELSQRVLDGIQPGDGDVRHFRDWMAVNCSAGL
jgi:predicted membrane-bound spermidine synthase